jgi:hypothetical protein
MANVKTMAGIYSKSGSGAPSTSTVGVLGDVYMDTATGLTYELTAIITTPSTAYTWTAYTVYDGKINLFLPRCEADYLAIRGIPYSVEDDEIVYPSGADSVAAEMCCFLAGLGRYTGRGKIAESLGSRSATYEKMLMGYPMSIIGSIDRYQSVV